MIKIDQNKKPISLFVVLVRSFKNRSIKSLSIVYLLGRSCARHKNNAGALRYALWTKVKTILTANKISMRPKKSRAKSSPTIQEVMEVIQPVTAVRIVPTVDRMVEIAEVPSNRAKGLKRLTKNANIAKPPFYYIRRYA